MCGLAGGGGFGFGGGGGAGCFSPVDGSTFYPAADVSARREHIAPKLNALLLAVADGIVEGPS